LIDVNEQKEEGEVMDIRDGICLMETGCVKQGDFKDAADADIIIITAGLPQKPGETRLDLVNKNKEILKSIFKGIGKIKPSAIVIMVANPVDVLTYLAQKISGLPKNQVFGSGTTLDTARLKAEIGRRLKVSPQSIHGYVLGEHGDTEFVAWSTVTVGGMPLTKMKKLNAKDYKDIEEKVRKEAYEIISRKGATFFGIALVLADLVEAILGRLPQSRLHDVILFDPSDVDRPQGLNLLEYDPNYPEQKTFVINEMIKILDKLYDLRQTGGPMFEQYMRNAMLLIMDDPKSGSTLMEISKVLADADYRRYKLSKVKDPVVRDFWTKEAQKAGGDAALANMVPYITSKLNQFVANDIMRPIIGQQTSAFNFRQLMDERKILLVRLSKGKLGEINAYLLGLVIVGKILMAALSRTDLPEYQRKNFYLYIDEFQNFITDSISVILSEARKYRLNLTIAHQYIGQLVQGTDTRIRDAVFGNVGTIVSFRVGVEDAEVLAKEFAPVFSAYDLINLELFQAYVKLLINNTPARPFNMAMLPAPPGEAAVMAAVRARSKEKYGRDRAQVEEQIITRSAIPVTPPVTTPPPAVPATQPPAFHD